MNLYSFINNSPVSNIDKLGLFPFCNKCKKLNEVIVIKEEVIIGTPDKTPEQIVGLNEGLHAVHQLETAANILELAEGKPSILFPKPDISDQSLIYNLLAFQPVNLFGRIKFKVCQNVGPRFFLVGSDQLDWIEYTQGWDPSDKNSYHSGSEAVEDIPRFMARMLIAIKTEYN